MSAQHPPLTVAQVEEALKRLGFEPRPKKSGTSHQDWVPRDKSARFRKVTVDPPKAPFTQDLIKSMARQAGVTKKQFYAVLGYGRKKRRKSRNSKK